jgi:aldose 1-epimerase
VLERISFGELNGTNVPLFVLKRPDGCEAHITSYGATLTRLFVPDRKGQLADVVLGFDTLEGYVQGRAFFGATIGRVANRIRAGKFTLNGQTYELTKNDPPNHLHGGPRGWDKALWTAVTNSTASYDEVRFSYVSPDGEAGYPGTVTAEVCYRLRDDRVLVVEMTANTDAPTLVNMAHHGYWNLGGHTSGPIVDHRLKLHADHYTPGDPVVPDGRTLAVVGTPFDFTRGKTIGSAISEVGPVPNGYDHNFVVRGNPNTKRPVAELHDPVSGRSLHLHANQPGVQLYSGNFLDGSVEGKGSTHYGHRSGLCLETQGYPDAINVADWRRQVLLEPAQTYQHVMEHRFLVE